MHKIVFPFLIIFVMASCFAHCNSEMNIDSSESETIYKHLLFFDFGAGKHAFSIAMGYRYFIFGISGGVTNFSKVPDHQDYACPHNDFTLKVHDENNVCLDLMLFIPIFNYFSFYVNGGITLSPTTTLAHSNVTDLIYIYDDETTYGGCYGAGVQVLPYKLLVLGLGFHSFRGYYFQIGLDVTRTFNILYN